MCSNNVDFTPCKELYSLLEQYNSSCDLSMPLDDMIDALSKYPELVSAYLTFLRDCFDKKEIIESKPIGKKKIIVYEVEANYDKRFFCAAKLADNAICTRYDSDRDVFNVTFRAMDVESVALMYYNLLNFFNASSSDFILTFDFLYKHHFLSYLSERISQFNVKKFSKYKNPRYSCETFSKYRDMVLVIEKTSEYFQSAIKASYKRKLNVLYKSICAEGRVPTKWCREYKFYLLVKRFVPDVVFQYTCSWLGKQSFDVFSPSLNLALEYQGEQHYAAVDFFGGSDGLNNNQMRDETKRTLANEHNVLLLEWKHSYHMSRFTVLRFLQKYGIALECEWDGKMPDDLEMAPVVLNSHK